VSVLEFKPRGWQIGVSWFLFGICLVSAAWLGRKGHDTFWWVLGHDAVQAVGTAALAFGGVAALIIFLRSRLWTRELQVIAVDLLDETIHHVGILSQLAAYVLFGGSGSLGELDQVFRLPWTFADDAEVEKAKSELHRASTVIGREGHVEIVARLQEVSVGLADRGSKLRDAALGLDRCIDDARPVLPLLAAVAELNRKIRVLIDEVPAPGSLFPPSPVTISVHAYQVLDESVTVARLIRAPFQQIRSQLRDHTLKTELNRKEERLKTMAGLEKAIRDWQALGSQINDLADKKAAVIEEVIRAAPRAREAVEFATELKDKARTDSELEFASRVEFGLNEMAKAFSEVQEIFSQWTPTAAPQDAPQDSEDNGGKQPEG